MFPENGGFDQSSSMHGGELSQSEDAFSQNSVSAAASALAMELQHQLEIEQCYGGSKSGGEIGEIVHESSNWHEMSGFDGGESVHHQSSAADFGQIYAAAVTASMAAAYPTAADSFSVFPPPRCSPPSLLPNFSQKSPTAFMASLGLLGDVNPSADGNGVVYDPLLPLNLPPQPPLLRELFHSLPNGGGVYTLGGSSNGGFFTNGVDEREALYQNGDGVFEFSAAAADQIGKGRDGAVKDGKQFPTERHRRVLLSDKYEALRSLIPSQNKKDRASIVGDAIEYINELKRTVADLKGLVEKKRCARERLKRPKTEENGSESTVDPYGSSSLRSSWLHRKSKNTEVDVRIVDDEITVKLVQQKRINCLLFVSKVLDELQLDLHHVAGGVVGDYYSYLFNSKICEGSIVYASAVANKLIDVVDKQYAAVPQASSSY